MDELHRPLVLMVEDNIVMADIVRRALQHGGLDVEIRHNAHLALEACRQHDFDAVVTDFQMPGLNGLEFVQALRTSDRNRNIPVVFVSGKGMELDTQRMQMEYGVAKVLFKPFSPQELIFHLRSCMGCSGSLASH